MHTKSDKIPNLNAAISMKTTQNVFKSNCQLRDRHVDTLPFRDCSILNIHNLSFQGRKLAWAGMSAMQLHSVSNYMGGSKNRAYTLCKGLYLTALVVDRFFKCGFTFSDFFELLGRSWLLQIWVVIFKVRVLFCLFPRDIVALKNFAFFYILSFLLLF